MMTSFFVKNNWQNILSGLGTGAITSVVVGLLMNLAIKSQNDIESKHRQEIVLSDLFEASISAYSEIIYRINNYVIYKEDMDQIYGIYDDKENFKSFIAFLEKYSFYNSDDSASNELIDLINPNNWWISQFASEIKNISKQDLYISGILTEEEEKEFFSNMSTYEYMRLMNFAQEEKKSQGESYKNQIKLLSVTIMFCCQVINMFDSCKKEIIKNEKAYKDYFDEIYFREVYMQSEEYWRSEIERAEAEQEYYDQHPELLEQLQSQYEEWENETQTDRAIKDMECLFFGFSSYSFRDLLKQADKSDPKLLGFLQRKNIKRFIKKNKYKKDIIDVYGKEYYKKIK